jgi:hypothetical protein
VLKHFLVCGCSVQNNTRLGGQGEVIIGKIALMENRLSDLTVGEHATAWISGGCMQLKCLHRMILKEGDSAYVVSAFALCETPFVTL